MIKKAIYFFIAGIISLLVLSPAMAQQTTATKNTKDFKFTLKTNPLAALGGPFWVIIVPVTGEYKILGEIALSKKISFQAGASYIGPSVLINLDKIKTDTASNVPGLKTSGYKFSGMLKFFLSRDLPAPKGFYVGPHISFASARLSSRANTNDYIGAKKLNINAVVGYQLITDGGFTLDIFTGMGFVSRQWEYHGNSSGDFNLGANKNGISIPLGLSFGYAF